MAIVFHLLLHFECFSSLINAIDYISIYIISIETGVLYSSQCFSNSKVTAVAYPYVKQKSINVVPVRQTKIL